MSPRNRSKKRPELDAIDRKILNLLQEDNQITNLELAERVGISAPPCLRRVRRLREEGVIMKDVSLVDTEKVGRNFTIFLHVSLESHREDLLENFERKMQHYPEVMQCYHISGDFDHLVVITVSDMQEYSEFLRRIFANEHNLKSYRSSFVLDRIKYNTKINV